MASVTLATNLVNDLYLVDGRNLSLLAGAEGCAQRVGQSTKMRLGENIYNTDEGVDYFGLAFSPQPDLDGLRVSIATNILAVPDVTGISTLDVSASGNNINFAAKINTIYGQISVSP